MKSKVGSVGSKSGFRVFGLWILRLRYAGLVGSRDDNKCLGFLVGLDVHRGTEDSLGPLLLPKSLSPSRENGLELEQNTELGGFGALDVLASKVEVCSRSHRLRPKRPLPPWQAQLQKQNEEEQALHMAFFFAQ